MAAHITQYIRTEGRLTLFYMKLLNSFLYGQLIELIVLIRTVSM